MSSHLAAVVVLLMIISIMLTTRFTAVTDGCVKTDLEQSRSRLHKAFGVVGILIAFGGIWIDWMLWVGIILIEFGCILYFRASKLA